MTATSPSWLGRPPSMRTVVFSVSCHPFSRLCFRWIWLRNETCKLSFQTRKPHMFANRERTPKNISNSSRTGNKLRNYIPQILHSTSERTSELECNRIIATPRNSNVTMVNNPSLTDGKPEPPHRGAHCTRDGNRSVLDDLLDMWLVLQTPTWPPVRTLRELLLQVVALCLVSLANLTQCW